MRRGVSPQALLVLGVLLDKRIGRGILISSSIAFAVAIIFLVNLSRFTDMVSSNRITFGDRILLTLIGQGVAWLAYVGAFLVLVIVFVAFQRKKE